MSAAGELRVLDLLINLVYSAEINLTRGNNVTGKYKTWWQRQYLLLEINWWCSWSDLFLGGIFFLSSCSNSTRSCEVEKAMSSKSLIWKNTTRATANVSDIYLCHVIPQNNLKHFRNAWNLYGCIRIEMSLNGCNLSFYIIWSWVFLCMF